MTAVMTRMVRSGKSPVIDASDRLVMIDGPDTYAHVWRVGLRVEWEITAGKYGESLAWGRTWTQAGAWVEAIAAAHRPSARGGAR